MESYSNMIIEFSVLILRSYTLTCSNIYGILHILVKKVYYDTFLNDVINCLAVLIYLKYGKWISMIFSAIEMFDVYDKTLQGIKCYVL